MKCWTILALFFAICVVFLGVGHTEKTAQLEDLEKQPSEDVENEEQLADSFMNRENDGIDLDKSENSLDSENETPGDEDQPSMFKRTPFWRRRRRRRRRFRIRIRVRRIRDKIKKFCKKVSPWSPSWLKKACGFVDAFGRDEEKARVTNVGPNNQADEVERESRLSEEGN